jgi:hypothetical protein
MYIYSKSLYSGGRWFTRSNGTYLVFAHSNAVLQKAIFMWRPTVYVLGQGSHYLGLSQLLPAGAGSWGGGEEEGGRGAEEGAEEGQAPAQTVRAQDQEHRRGTEASGTVYIQY